MINILRKIIVLFGTNLQILLRIGITRGEKNNMADRIRGLEESVDDKEEDIKKEKDVRHNKGNR
jgi:hypothetical protein